ncbi:hypothetical protein ACU5DF_07070 [Aliivibrio wodanis]|uniref:hypothetical protein n=1 Tax=Aliivibrio wodanis TaxID=80852 RepID=UPI00406D46D6
MKKFLSTVLILFSISVSAVEVQREVVGYGISRTEAINDAISEAVRQQFGVTVSSDTISKLVAKETEDALEFSQSSDTGSKQQFSGRVSSYDIIDVVCASNECEARLNVKFELSQREINKRKDQQSIDNRKTLFLDVKGKYADQFHTNLESRFVQARKFAILQNRKEADYILTVNVIRAATSSSKTTKVVELTGESSTINTKYSVVNVEYKVLKVSTGQIVSSNSQRTTSSSHEVSTLLERWASEKLFKDVHSHIFPIRIVMTNNTQIIIGEGGKNIRVGDYFDVYRVGENIIDPYTGESLGAEELHIGVVRITKVGSKKSYATSISGESVSRLDILRKKKQAHITNNSSKSKSSVLKIEEKTVGIIL